MLEKIVALAEALPHQTFAFILSPFYYEAVGQEKGLESVEGPAFWEVNEDEPDENEPDIVQHDPGILPYIPFILGEGLFSVGVHAVTSGGVFRLEGLDS